MVYDVFVKELEYYGSVGSVQTTHHLPIMVHDVVVKEPEYFVERKMVKHQGGASTMVLVKWQNHTEE